MRHRHRPVKGRRRACCARPAAPGAVQLPTAQPACRRTECRAPIGRHWHWHGLQRDPKARLPGGGRRTSSRPQRKAAPPLGGRSVQIPDYNKNGAAPAAVQVAKGEPAIRYSKLQIQALALVYTTGGHPTRALQKGATPAPLRPWLMGLHVRQRPAAGTQASTPAKFSWMSWPTLPPATYTQSCSAAQPALLRGVGAGGSGAHRPSRGSNASAACSRMRAPVRPPNAISRPAREVGVGGRVHSRR